ncbi:DUF3578 domain-containing protein [Priestia megaterium]
MSLRERLLYVAEHYKQMGGDVLVKHEIENMLTRRLPISLYRLEHINREEMRISGHHAETFPYVTLANKNIESDVMVAYLFSEDGQRIYLVMMRGDSEEGTDLKDIRFFTPEHARVLKDNHIVIGTSMEAKSFEDRVALYLPYNIADLPSNDQLQEDLHLLLSMHEQYIKTYGMSKEMMGTKTPSSIFMSILGNLDLHMNDMI